MISTLLILDSVEGESVTMADVFYYITELVVMLSFLTCAYSLILKDSKDCPDLEQFLILGGEGLKESC